MTGGSVRAAERVVKGENQRWKIGADWARGPLTVGLSVGRTLGLGGYSGPSGGQMTKSMTGFYPWVGYQVNERVSVWGVTGYGTGSLSLTPDGQSALDRRSRRACRWRCRRWGRGAS